jgi:dTDP-4-dehydrorhamnose reductase
MATILITGANGQLGSEFRDVIAHYPQHHFHFYSRAELDIADAQSVQAVFEQVKPDVCVNCAAYTAVDKAETETEAAFAINATGTQNLATACAQYGARFIHISTDYVFDGTGTEPYGEIHPTSPVNAYGQSKLQGEVAALKANPETIVIRTSWVYSAHGANFVKTMLRLMQSRPEISVVADQKGSPTYAADLAAAILQIIESGKWQGGIYHFSNEGVITWFEFAQAIKELSNAACTVHPITTQDYPTPAKRPAYSVMDKTKIQQTFGLQLKDWKESLQQCLAKLAQQ